MNKVEKAEWFVLAVTAFGVGLVLFQMFFK